MSKRQVIILLLMCLFLNGCLGSIFNLGKNKTKCEEVGCDYSDAGACLEPLTVLHNKKKSNLASYNNIQCGIRKKINEE